MKKNNALGILGALIGAILFSIPWIITYIYLNYILSLLAMVIAFGSFYFYKLFGGEVTKKTSIVVTISSLLSITLATFVFIPLCLMLKENIAINAENISLVYQNSEFIGALVSDYLVSLLFTALGIGGIIRSINQQAYQVNGSEIKALTSDDVQSIYEEYGALSKDKAVPNSLILGRVPYKELRRLEKEGIIVPKGTKSYFDIEAVTNKEKGKEYAAIASKIAAKKFDLNILAEQINDEKDNKTRFILLTRTPLSATENDKTSIFFSVKNEPGSLVKVLNIFDQEKINLMYIESRPSKKKMGEYNFCLDLEGHVTDKNIASAIEKAEKITNRLVVTGSYPQFEP